MIAVTWVVRVERAPRDQIARLYLVEIVNTGHGKDYICSYERYPLMEPSNLTLSDVLPIFARFLDEPVVGESYDVYYCYNFYGGIVGLVLTHSTS